MRARYVRQFASNTAYSTGPRTGNPNKIVPPTAYLQDGIVPGAAFAAEWENYLKFHTQKQANLSASIPFRNFFPVSLSGAFTEPFRCAHSPLEGLTFFVTQTDNTIFYVPDAALDQTMGVDTLGPVAGDFTPRDVAVNRAGMVICVGSNSTNTARNIWVSTPLSSGSSFLEVTNGAAAGTIDRVTVDAATGHAYLFLTDTDRSVLRIDDGATLLDAPTLVGVRGSGAKAASACEFAVYNGTIVSAYRNDSGNLEIQYSSEPYSTWTTRTFATHNGFDPDVGCPVRYSEAYDCWMLMGVNPTPGFGAEVLYMTSPSAPATALPSFHAYLGRFKLFDGAHALTDVGSASFDLPDPGGLTLTRARLWLRDSLDSTRDPFAVSLGVQHDNANHCVRYDGSALWVLTTKSGTKRLYRSLRVCP